MNVNSGDDVKNMVYLKSDVRRKVRDWWRRRGK